MNKITNKDLSKKIDHEENALLKVMGEVGDIARILFSLREKLNELESTILKIERRHAKEDEKDQQA